MHISHRLGSDTIELATGSGQDRVRTSTEMQELKAARLRGKHFLRILSLTYQRTVLIPLKEAED